MTKEFMDGKISIVDLRETPSQDFLDGFIKIYNKTFTDPREREDPAEWPARMWQKPPAPQPWTHLLVALSADSGRVVGGLVFEHYRGSHCGLLTYLVVESAWRKKGIARNLVDRALFTLIRDELDSGGKLKAVFCEIEDPQLVSDEDSAMPTCKRLHALLHLGARVLDLNYVQPGLVGGAGPCDHLLLLAFDLQNRSEEAVNGRPPEIMAGQTVYDFLHEFYRALGISDPEEDQSFKRMKQHLTEGVALQDPRERPALNLKEVAVCLHYVPQWDSPPEQAQPYPDCTVFRSIELDLMSYGYQIPTHRLLGSRCEIEEPIPVEIRFPDRVEYHTEGRDMLLLPMRRTCRAQAMVSSTLFLVSGIRVWHVVLVPEKDEAFTEYDIIKLIHLYDGRTENTDLAAKVKFRVGASGGGEVTVEELLPALLEILPERPEGCRPQAARRWPR